MDEPVRSSRLLRAEASKRRAVRAAHLPRRRPRVPLSLPTRPPHTRIMPSPATEQNRAIHGCSKVLQHNGSESSCSQVRPLHQPRPRLARGPVDLISTLHCHDHLCRSLGSYCPFITALQVCTWPDRAELFLQNHGPPFESAAIGCVSAAIVPPRALGAQERGDRAPPLKRTGSDSDVLQ